MFHNKLNSEIRYGRNSIKASLQISLLHIQRVPEILEIKQRIQITASILSLVHEIHLIPSLEIGVQQMGVMSGVDELGMVAMIEHTYHKFHQLGMETVIYLIDKEHLSFMDNTNHPHHHPEQSLGSLRLFRLEIKRNGRVGTMKRRDGIVLNLEVNDVAICCSQHLQHLLLSFLEQIIQRINVSHLIIKYDVIAEEQEIFWAISLSI